MRSSPLLLVALAACTVVVDVEEPDRSPVPVILRPSPDELVLPGELTMTGRVTDPQDPPETLFVTWAVGADEAGTGGWTTVCDGFVEADGTTRCTAELAEGVGAVRLLASDLAGFQGTAIAPVRVRDVAAPTVEIRAPLPPGPFFANVDVPLEVVVADADTAPGDLTLTVVSNLDGALPVPGTPDAAGRWTGNLRLRAGVHTVEVRAVDPDGAEGAASVLLSVSDDNLAPTCAFDTPVAGDATLPDAPLPFRASALDDVARPEDLAWSLTSDLDGELASGRPGTDGWLQGEVALPPGLHTLTLTVTDPWGAVGTCAVTVPSDTPPFLLVLTPAEGQRVPRGQPLTVAVRVEDAVTPPADLLVSVTSDRDGPRWSRAPGDDGSLTVQTALSPGIHQVRVRATDAYGLVAEQVFQVIAE